MVEKIERPLEKPEIMTKPLPVILDEMEANIKAAADAAKRAEEAARAARGAAVADMVVVDRDGRLEAALGSLPMTAPTPATSESVAELCGRFANWWVLGRNVLSRGELEREVTERETAMITG